MVEGAYKQTKAIMMVGMGSLPRDPGITSCEATHATLLYVSGGTGKVQVDVCVHDRKEGVIHRWQGPVTMTRTGPGRWIMTVKKLVRAGKCRTGCVP